MLRNDSKLKSGRLTYIILLFTGCQVGKTGYNINLVMFGNYQENRYGTTILSRPGLAGV